MARNRLTPWLLLLGLLSGCATLPDDYPKEESFAVPASAETPLGLSATAWVSSHDGRSGFFPLQSGSDALAARLRMIERAVLDVETARASAEPRPLPSKGKNPPTGTADCEGLFQTKTKEETLDAYVRRWLDASPAKARTALEASLATADAGAGGSKAGALVAAARADTTKVRAKLREAILAAFEGEKGWSL